MMVPIVTKRDGLWVALLGNKVIFKSLDRKNVVDYIKYTWNGVNDYAQP
jgi:hypothetical protein